MTENPDLNDGLKLQLFIQEYNHSPEALALLARAEFWERQHQYNQALSVLDSLLAEPSKTPLLAEALYRKGMIEIQLQRFKQSTAAFDTLLSRFPSSLLADKALERTGWIFEKSGNTKMAIQRYEALLVTYPQSLMADMIRSRIRHIENEGNQ